METLAFISLSRHFYGNPLSYLLKNHNANQKKFEPSICLEKVKLIKADIPGSCFIGANKEIKTTSQFPSSTGKKNKRPTKKCLS